MPQLFLPMIPSGATGISDTVSVVRENGRWEYFLGLYPIFQHHESETRLFKLITSQLINSGACRHRDIMKTFGVSKSSVNRALKKYRQGGANAFFQRKKGGRRGTVLTDEKLQQAQKLLDEDLTRRQISQELEISTDTLRKAINDGRLVQAEKVYPDNNHRGCDKSSRNVADALAADAMGTACTRTIERVFASLGEQNGTETRFEACVDVVNAGVICALPALLVNGLLDGIERFLGKIKGYYTVFHVLLVVAFMSLCRIKSVEQLRGKASGEFGKTMGIDRIPEVRCLREKMDLISADNASEKWAAHLSQRWLQNDLDETGTLYIDGHQRVYNGKLTKLPRRYIARQRLCLRATTQYWVNDAIGRPFFLIEKPIDPGLLKTLESDIVPRLIKDISNQPSQVQLHDNPYLCRFVLVFDREGYSPAFFGKMWQEHRIACITYHKFPGAAWPEQWFEQQEVVMPGGETVTMRLAEMGTLVGCGKDAVWMREVRKLTKSGHQTSLISTGYELDHIRLAASMFTRWCQENFFKYMRQHFEIDILTQYGVEDIADTERVVNPSWRELNRIRNQLQNKIRYRQARFAEMTIHPQIDTHTEKYQKWIKKKSELLEGIEQTENELKQIKSKIKEVAKYVSLGELPKEERFCGLRTGRKRLVDTVKMIAYRSETSMIPLLTGPTVNTADARRLLQDLFISEADIFPEAEKKVLRIRVHNASRPAANRSLEKMFEKLNETKTKYPGTDMTIVYELVN